MSGCAYAKNTGAYLWTICEVCRIGGEVMNEKRVRCWHFLQEDRRLRWGSKEVVEVGKTYTAEGPLKMCKNGMHGSRQPINALRFAPGPIVCEVEIWGEIEEEDDKVVGRHRKVLSMMDASEVLHRFACDIAEKALKQAGMTDERSWAAIRVKRTWLKGKATDNELAAAGAAAWAAAWAAGAAGAAARAAARAAAGAAARDAMNSLLTRRIRAMMRR